MGRDTLFILRCKNSNEVLISTGYGVGAGPPMWSCTKVEHKVKDGNMQTARDLVDKLQGQYPLGERCDDCRGFKKGF